MSTVWLLCQLLNRTGYETGRVATVTPQRRHLGDDDDDDGADDNSDDDDEDEDEDEDEDADDDADDNDDDDDGNDVLPFSTYVDCSTTRAISVSSASTPQKRAMSRTDSS